MWCVRVSTDAQNTSIHNQQKFFSGLEKNNWELTEIYTDEALSGIECSKRLAFHKVMSDARNGKYTILL